jgi:predicted O-methyltransferase YrrM
MPSTLDVVAAATRQRIAALPPARAARAALDQRSARRVRVADPTLHAVVRALTAPAAGEDRWVEAIEAKRRALESSSETITFVIDADQANWWRDYISRSRAEQPPVLRDSEHVDRQLGELATSTSRPTAWGRLFYRVVRALHPERSVELGTSVGMSAAYFGAGHRDNQHGRLTTVEGQRNSADVAERVFSELAIADHVDVVCGQFDDVLPGVLEKLGTVDLAFIDGNHHREPTLRYFEMLASRTTPGGLLVFDDIFYPLDHGMEAAWRDIRADRRVTASLTVGTVGFGVVNGRIDQHHTLKRLPVH